MLGIAGAGQAGGEQLIEHWLARFPAELAEAEERPSDSAGLEALERDLLADPCHCLRRACQIADYGAPGADS